MRRAPKESPSPQRALNRPLRVGLAGVAALYWPHAIADGIGARRDAVLVSLATLGEPPAAIRDHLGMTAEELARRTGARQYQDVDEMMGRERIDALALCTRHTEHARWVERLSRHGKDIFIAKTFATRMADAERICAAEAETGIRIAVGPSARYLPWFAAAKSVVAAGRIGTPFALRISHNHGTIDVFHHHDFYRDPREGGPELSLGWYMVDLVLHFLRQPVARVSAEYGTFTSPDSPFMDCGRMSLRMADGAIASCDMYFCNRFAFPGWEMEIVGEKGALLVRQPLGDSAAPLVQLTTTKGVTQVPLPARTPHWELFWIDDFRARRAPSMSAVHAREVTRICLAARAAAQRGRPVSLGRS